MSLHSLIKIHHVPSCEHYFLLENKIILGYITHLINMYYSKHKLEQGDDYVHSNHSLGQRYDVLLAVSCGDKGVGGNPLWNL